MLSCCGATSTIESEEMSSAKITLYYWPMHFRCGALIYMMEEKGVTYEHVSEKEKMATKATAFGATTGINIAPPIIEDGGKLISQSTACTMYLGKKLGFDKGVDDCFAVQYMADIVDWCEGGIGKNNEDATLLKKFMEGGRFAVMAGCVERNIKGPYFFGDEPSFVDFFLLQHMDWRKDLFEKLQAATGTDFLGEYPKIKGVAANLRLLPSYKNFSGFKYGSFKQDIVDAYSKL
mmetsp:Transcript_63282/g.184957  ORF Transcript_63282/g.184957 Transcript_63282/m.184957 type:complete len:234 (-) Transcript_63282:38-739(-)